MLDIQIGSVTSCCCGRHLPLHLESLFPDAAIPLIQRKMSQQIVSFLESPRHEGPTDSACSPRHLQGANNNLLVLFDSRVPVMCFFYRRFAELESDWLISYKLCISIKHALEYKKAVDLINVFKPLFQRRIQQCPSLLSQLGAYNFSLVLARCYKLCPSVEKQLCNVETSGFRLSQLQRESLPQHFLSPFTLILRKMVPPQEIRLLLLSHHPHRLHLRPSHRNLSSRKVPHLSHLHRNISPLAPHFACQAHALQLLACLLLQP
mmetsp:Transcript_2561/g.6150  ORF Transcript_2561/g.6150 Transcript_2561/m.6150 type:complete len:263 (-) Transcript_2561:380-1168(-)